MGWGRRWEKKVQEEDHKYTYGWFILMFGRDQHCCKAIILQWKNSKIKASILWRPLHYEVESHPLKLDWLCDLLWWIKCDKVVSILSLCVLVAQLYLTLLTLWTIAHQAPLSMGFSKQEQWSELPFPPPGDLPNPLIKLASPSLLCAGRFFTCWATGEAHSTELRPEDILQLLFLLLLQFCH